MCNESGGDEADYVGIVFAEVSEGFVIGKKSLRQAHHFDIAPCLTSVRLWPIASTAMGTSGRSRLMSHAAPELHTNAQWAV